MEIKNVKILKAEIEIEDHGIMTFNILVEGEGIGVSIGNYCGFTDTIIRNILELVGVEKWSALKGQYIRIKTEWGERVHEIGNIIENKWLDLDSLYEQEKES